MGLLERFRRAPKPAMRPRGGSGRMNLSGFLELEELNAELMFPAGLRVFDKMYRTDPDIRRQVWMVCNPIIGGTWSVDPYGGDEAEAIDREAAEFVEWALFEHMRPKLTGHFFQALPVAIRSGFAPFEQVWEVAEWNGKERLVPKTLGLRLPRTIQRFTQDGEELVALHQFLPDQGLVELPAADLVYYRFGAEGDNWEGTSLLRAAYKPWLLKDKLERIDAIAQEREAVGVPICYPPQSGTDDGVLDEIEEILGGLRSAEQSYIVAPGPHADNAETGQGWRFEILSHRAGEGSRDIQPSLKYHTDKIAAAFIAEFMRLGQSNVGARATADVQQDPFLASVEAIAGQIEDVLNDALVARMVALNYDVAEAPKLRMSLVDSTTLTELKDYVQGLVIAQALHPDPVLEDYLRDRADLPPVDQAARQAREQAAATAREALAGAPMPPAGDQSAPGAQDPASPADPAQQPAQGGNGRQMGRTLARQDRPLRPWEEHMSLDAVESAIDEARARFEQAAGAEARAVARAQAQAALRGRVPKLSAPPDLEDQIAGVLEDLYRTGRVTVGDELASQRGQTFPAGTGSMLSRARTLAVDGPAGSIKALRRRARLAAQGVVATIWQAVSRAALGSKASEASVQAAGEIAAAAALRAEAQVHAAPALNLGRTDEADAHASEIAGSRYTSILDGNRCLAPEALVRTAAGEKRADAVTLDDCLLTHVGRYVRPSQIAVSDAQEELVSIRVGGRMLRATLDHPVLVVGTHGFAWRHAGELAVGDLVVSDLSLERRYEVISHDLGFGQAPDPEAPVLQDSGLAGVGVAPLSVPVGAVALDHETAHHEVHHPAADGSLLLEAQAQDFEYLAGTPLDGGLGGRSPVAAIRAVAALLRGHMPEALAAVGAWREGRRAVALLRAVGAGSVDAVTELLAAARAGRIDAAVLAAALERAVRVARGVGDRHAEMAPTAGADFLDPVAATLRGAVGMAALETPGEALAATLARGRRILRSVARASHLGDAPTLASGATLAADAVVADRGAAVEAGRIHDCTVCLAAVESVERERYAGPVYDFTIPGDHTLWAEGMLVHNCDQCALADDDVLRPLSDPVRLERVPPNPDCFGGDRCRCMEFFQMREEAPGYGGPAP